MKAILLLLSVALGVWGNYEHTERVRAQRAIAGAETTRQQALDASAFNIRQIDEVKRLAGVQETNFKYQLERLQIQLEASRQKNEALTSQLASAQSRSPVTPAPVVQYRAAPATVDPLARFYPKTNPVEERLGNIEYELQRQTNAERFARFNEGFNRR